MGGVYEVEHTQLGVHYALKAFTLEGGHVDVLKNKFLTEGKVLARLHDPHLVRVFDMNFDEATGTPYFVMELVLSEDGRPRTLSDVNTAELDEDSVLQWFAELASVVDYIHREGVVHRDIKLGNVLLSSDGHVILSDFGISRLFSEQLRSDVKAVNTMVSEAATGARLVMGTQGYMAPEVADGKEATPAADSYSLGVMFVYLLTGIWYEPGSKVFKLLETLEYRWIDVLPRLLAEDPAERPTNLAELVELLRSVPGPKQEKAEEPEAPPRRKRRAFLALALAGAAAVTVAVIGYFVFFNRSAPAAIDDFDAAFSGRGIYEGSRQ
jgi:serine/threonine protein kinase